LRVGKDILTEKGMAVVLLINLIIERILVIVGMMDVMVVMFVIIIMVKL
jgi:hypothetical protein